MNSQKFSGWKTVFQFTFHQAVSRKGFKIVTALVAIVIVAALVIINILMAKPYKEENVQPTSIKTVLVLDQSGLQPTDFGSMITQIQKVRFDEIEFVQSNANNRQDVITQARDTLNAIAVIITKNGTSFQMEAVAPDGVSKGDTEELLSAMADCLESSKMLQAGLNMEQLTTLLTPVNSAITEVGEDHSIATVLIKMLAPMLFGLILYMMLMFYGQTISKEVSCEKTSKLMESLLTSIHPYSLITGKILGIASMAFLQLLIWIAALIGGLYGGNAVAHTMYPEYENSVVTMINFLRENIGQSALSLPAIVLGLLIFCVGFLFYCVLAGLAGSVVSKPEDIASTQGIFIFPLLISWLLCYLAPVMEKEEIIAVARYIPFTIPFCSPVDLLTGSISIVEGVIGLAILLAFTALVIMFSARVYKGLVLYNGQKVSLKTIGKIIKAKN